MEQHHKTNTSAWATGWVIEVPLESALVAQGQR